MLAKVLCDTKHENDKTSEWLLDYPQRKNAYIEALEAIREFTELSSTQYTGLPGGCGVGRPSEEKGLRLVRIGITEEELQLQEKWLEVVELAEQTMSEKKLVFLELRRGAENLELTRGGKHPWVTYVQVRYADWHYRRFGRASVPSRQTMIDWWNAMVNVTVRLAIRKGCL